MATSTSSLARGKFWLTCCLLLSLTACGTTSKITAPANPDFESHRQAVLAVDSWQLSGRLNIRENNDSDRVSLNWRQNQQQFDITLWGTLGLGSTRIFGTDQGLTIERSDEPAVQLPNFEALSREYLTFDFPAQYLLYWVRGVPVPDLDSSQTFDSNNLLATLSQRDPTGRNWELTFDQYAPAGNLNLPGRIRIVSGNIQLTFRVDAWESLLGSLN